jgi:hypothetical protein
MFKLFKTNRGMTHRVSSPTAILRVVIIQNSDLLKKEHRNEDRSLTRNNIFNDLTREVVRLFNITRKQHDI